VRAVPLTPPAVSVRPPVGRGGSPRDAHPRRARRVVPGARRAGAVRDFGAIFKLMLARPEFRAA